ncbi:MAG: EAL domain-containing protein [Alteromonadaceae bacterium]|nr:EAL domain-containing protein [Alteromonadaceae bacterium]
MQTNINWLKDIDAYDLHIVDITERKLAEQKVKNLAFYVQETQLPNLYKLNKDVDNHINSHHKFTFGLFEILDFNHLVSTHGLEATNELVCEMTKIISQNLPDTVNLYQINESQFALLCPDSTSSASLQLLTEKIKVSVDKPIVTCAGDLFIELSFGYCFYPDHGQSRNQLFKNVHSALAIAAQNEYDHFSLFNLEFSEKIQASATLIDNLRNALQLNELYLVFQPQLSLAEQKITGIETLVRWKHQNIIISPADFIPLAEQSGLIIPIGKWILHQACIFAKKLVDEGYKEIVVAVNVSPRQFSHPDFSQNVNDILAETQLPAKNLELEITEGVFVHNESRTLCVMKELKAIGIHLSIDDFGTGYSSLSYLKRFPVDKLKIDQSFILDCHTNEEDKALVKTIVSLGKNLGLSLIAEGVELREHVDYLKDIECDEIQGYWFSRPLEADALVELLKKS